jgi:predicted nucleic acid-binding protein
VIAVDTSVVVAGLSPWHERHELCRTLLDDQPGIVGHVLVETFSVLTRLPVPFRIEGKLVSELLSMNFVQPPLMLTPAQLAQFVIRLSQWQVRGGAVYDALIAATAREAGATLMTLDSRAHRTYQAVGAEVRIV